MKLFSSKEITPMTTGTDVLREALRARMHKGPAVAASLARDLGVGTATLDGFAHGKGTLPVAIMNTLAKDFFGDNASFDAERDLLTRAKQVATPIGTAPPPCKPTVPILGPSGWPPLRSAKPEPQKLKGPRPGWAEN